MISEGIFALIGVLIGFFLGRLSGFQAKIPENFEKIFPFFKEIFEEKPKNQKIYGNPIVINPDEIEQEKEEQKKDEINELYPFEK